MTIAPGAEAMGDPSAVASSIIALTAWVSDPAVMTAIASLLTAAAAFWRSRYRRSVEQAVSPSSQPQAPSLAEAYSTLHEAEEKIREELLQQLQHRQEEAEQAGQDLTYFRKATATLEEAVIRCPEAACPVRDQIKLS
ncbi:MAG: hypothetical protein ACR2P3_06925 [Geminicoccaceae bacterium]